ncbi:MAG: hypothetical protein LBH06_03710 [Rikenellaceae bacterium]|jgi:hypothetical protein|nr:hypothetical protein [Rikenellaceae bacterium]
MKKITILMAAIGLTTVNFASAQDEQPASNYINIAYNFQQLGVNENSVKPLDWGAGLEFGKTFFAHKEPIAQMLWLGIDWSYVDLQYATKKEDTSIVTHVAQAGMQVGPSLTVTLFDALYLKANVRYAPTYSAYACRYGTGADQMWDVYSGYTGYITAGFSASFKLITAGFEYRANTNVPEFSPNAKKGLMGSLLGDKKVKFEMPSARVYLGFRF